MSLANCTKKVNNLRLKVRIRVVYCRCCWQKLCEHFRVKLVSSSENSQPYISQSSRTDSHIITTKKLLCSVYSSFLWYTNLSSTLFITLTPTGGERQGDERGVFCFGVWNFVETGLSDVRILAGSRFLLFSGCQFVTRSVLTSTPLNEVSRYRKKCSV